MNACLTTTGVMRQFHRLFGVLVISLFSLQVMAAVSPVVVSVDHRVTATFSKPQFDAKKGVYTTQVRIRNSSAASLLSPLRLTIGQFEGKNVKPLNAQGVGKDGQPYFEFALPKGVLAAGGVTETVKVVFVVEKNNDIGAAKERVAIKSRIPSSFVYHVSAGVELAPMAPRAEPYALNVDSGKVNVRFSVRLLGRSSSTDTVYLRRVGEGKGIAMNDQGRVGDLVAKDGIYGANILMDASKMKPDTCLNYEAFVNIGHAEVASSLFSLCVSNIPVQVAASNKANTVRLSNGMQAIADELLLTVVRNTKTTAIRRLAEGVNAKVVGSIPSLNLYQLKLQSAVSANRLLELVSQLNSQPQVKETTVNAIGSYAFAPNDPAFNLLPSDATSQHGLKLVLAHDEALGANAWDGNTRGAGVTVVVLDIGLDRTHADFGTSPGNCQLVDDDCGGVNNDAVGHGTQVAGVIGARTNNGTGIAGVAYGAKIHAIQASPDMAYTLLEMENGFNNVAIYVASHAAASVINASFILADPTVLDSSPNPAVHTWTTLCNAVNSVVLESDNVTPRAVVINAVGNSGANGKYYPARCNDLNAGLTRKDLFITVSNSTSVTGGACAASSIDQRCTTSNFGSWVDIAAPGSAIRTTTLGNAYANPSGTSFSAPMVAGAAAILRSCSVPLDQIQPTLVNSAIEFVSYPASGINPAGTTPRLDIHRALSYQAPSAIALTPSNSINENNAAGATVASLSATDLDICDKFTFAPAVGAGDTDNGAFTITGNQLTINGVADFDTKPNYSIRVRVTDFGGLTFEQSLTVNVVNVNEAPAGTNATVTTNEDTAYTFSAANFGFTDPLDSPPNNLSAVLITDVPSIGALELGGVSVANGQIVPIANLGDLTFMPVGDASGSPYSSFTFQVVDDGGSVNGGVNSDPTPNTLTINVSPMEDALSGTLIIDPAASPATRQIGDELTANTGLLSDADCPALTAPITSSGLCLSGPCELAYQWKRSADFLVAGVPISGATNKKYTLSHIDASNTDYEKYISLCVSTGTGAACSQRCMDNEATAVGDPHITTVDGLRYDFQGAGEFVALRGANGMEIQLRMAAVSTAPPLPDDYTGLTSGVSVNTAVAARVGKLRVTYQPDTDPNAAADAFVLRVEGNPVTPPADGIDLGNGGRVLPLAGGGIQIDFPDQTTLMVNTSSYPFYGAHWLHINVFHTSAYEGLMGARSKGSWLPRLSDGSALGPKPAALHDRYEELYGKFADSWRVNKETTLFDYDKGTSTETFTNKAWPTENGPYDTGTGPVAKPLELKAAQLACRGVVGKNEKANCVFDVRVMGHADLAKGHLLHQKIRLGATNIFVRDDRDVARDKEVVTFTATVARHAAIARMEFGRKGVPTGTVQFTLNGKKIEKPIKLNAKGQAIWRVSRQKVEKQLVGAQYIPAKGSVFLPSRTLGTARLPVDVKK